MDKKDSTLIPGEVPEYGFTKHFTIFGVYKKSNGLL